jgi:hypothetical protein
MCIFCIDMWFKNHANCPFCRHEHPETTAVKLCPSQVLFDSVLCVLALSRCVSNSVVWPAYTLVNLWAVREPHTEKLQSNGGGLFDDLMDTAPILTDNEARVVHMFQLVIKTMVSSFAFDILLKLSGPVGYAIFGLGLAYTASTSLTMERWVYREKSRNVFET